ncbi:efflux RND transporter periplasmic adaptor subunit [Yersinia enterocolitica]|uniref:Type I secretion protein n=1 Tax=Yersinia enterocolitica serotype O:8 / biotype 1B (strain NCTC 13174 / 8081) TaxID=393305 RepID=A1JJV7_YERE8|nr:efflux RND transporter periplasmic adaptor subunit [Yersinia enterocolitica]AJJ23949.1 efflux transporter, RND family, MFP subunit [Yersinia enterocolitica]CAL10894.1 putative type I secretion protein [Yersinia enterocolitica subsp. enterocolitica 8081]CNG37763.1 putative type I secretion protein [Yersinia enterocolitica]HDL7646840.1 efflux RND transporter periplasmic adaptor subunit [Yersinia enterocolitica]HDL7747822.1 efflux RND transporter periplasmic adaptor subunit [Yersinia enterocol
MRINLKNKKHQLMLGLFIVSLLIISSVIALSISDSQQDVPQLTETIGRGDIERNVMATGSLKPSLQVNVGAQVNGQLTKLYVKQGDRVTRGQLLAEIDPTLQQNELRKSEAELQSAQAQKQASQALLRQYLLEFRRQQTLARDGSGVKSALEKAQAQYDSQLAQLHVNEAQIVQSQMAMETAKANLGFTRIMAPIDGEVLGIVTKEGQTIVSSQTAPTILVLANVDTMTVHTRISETDILKVNVGQPLWFYVVADPERRYDSRMDAIQEASAESLREDSSGSANSQQPSAVYYNGIFNIANQERLLRTSMTAQVFIITAQAKNVLRVPLSALGEQQPDKRYRVQIINGKQTSVRWVSVGLRNAQYAEVKAGLAQGDQVLLLGTPAGVSNEH